MGFTLTLHEMTPELFDKGKQDHFASDMAANLGVEASQIEVVRFQAGSLVVETKIIGLKHSDHAKEMAAQVKDKTSSGGLLSPQHFGPCTVHNIEAKVREAPKKAPADKDTEGGGEVVDPADKELDDLLNDDAWLEEDPLEGVEEEITPASPKKKQEGDLLGRLSKMKGNTSFAESNAMPRWRWELANGGTVPKHSVVLKGKRLLRAVGYSVLFTTLFLRTVKQHKLNAKEADAQATETALAVYLDQSRGWLIKLLKDPVTSVLQDTKQKLSLKSSKAANLLGKFKGKKKEGAADNFGKGVSKSLLRLKVRIKGIVDKLCQEPVPERLVKVLKTISSDGNYFPMDFLFPSEAASFEFTELGATLNMAAGAPAVQEEEEEKELAFGGDVGGGDDGSVGAAGALAVSPAPAGGKAAPIPPQVLENDGAVRPSSTRSVQRQTTPRAGALGWAARVATTPRRSETRDTEKVATTSADEQAGQGAAGAPEGGAPSQTEDDRDATPLRTREFVVNLLVTRVLICHVILRPWQSGIGRRPAGAYHYPAQSTHVQTTRPRCEWCTNAHIQRTNCQFTTTAQSR